MPLRCLLVDDNDAFLETASLLLEREGLTVVGVASNIAEALRQTRALRPDLILVDIGLGSESGFTLARLLAGNGQGADVIWMSKVVPPPGGLVMCNVPPSASIRSPSPVSPEPRAGSAPPVPSSRIASRAIMSSAPSSTCTAEARACLAALATASDTA
jgi:CheY-like chemotaxis protein